LTNKLLSVNSIDVFYGDLPILKDISLVVDEGEIVLVLGSNGAGKTTLLKTILGFLRPAKGEIYFLGKRIDGLPPFEVVRRGISYVPSERELFPHMTVLENLELGSYQRRRWGKEDILRYVFSLFPVLGEKRKQLAGTLSGGEQQMLAIGRALMSSPKLLMLDEPSTGLAPKLLSSLLRAIKQIVDSGTTILLVEQNVRQALNIADRAYVLENGSIILEGERNAIVHHPLIKKAYLGV